MSAPVLEVSGLAVRHGAVPAVDGVDLTVGAGETVALLGANGAGKSTLLAAIAGLTRASAGAIRLDGRPVTGRAAEVRARLGVGYVPEGRRVFPGMTVADNLEVAARAPRAERRRRLAAVAALFPSLAEHAARRAWTLSGGQQQMLAIGRALMGSPRVLLLDEPSLGLAPVLTAELFAKLREIADGGTAILLAEQNAARALDICQRGYVMRGGRVALAGDAAALRRGAHLETAFFGG